MNDHSNVEPYPEWKAAADLFLSSSKGPGDLLEFAWLYSAFGMPAPESAGSIPEYEKARLRFLKQFKAFESWLLEEQLFALKSRPGVGYEVVRPQEQAAWAVEQMHDRVSKELRKAGRRLLYTQLDQLSDYQRQQYVDAMARIGRLRGAMKAPRPLPKPGNAA